MIGGTAVSWKSQKQRCVSLLTAEAEYIALASAIQETLWLKQLTSDVLGEPSTITEIFEDNQSTICLAKNPQFHGKMKHVEIKYHFVRDHIEQENIKLVYCRSEEMMADMFTKGLPISQFVKLRKMIGMELIEQSTCK